MENTSNLIYLVVVIIAVVVIAIILYRSYYTTQEEREAHMKNLYAGIVIGVLGVIVIAYLYSNSSYNFFGISGGEGADAQEYGVRSSFKKWWREKSDINREGRRAASDAREKARRSAKERFREEKAARREALGESF